VLIQTSKGRSFGVDRTYYSANDKHIGPLVVHNRDCWGCVNKLMRCDVVAANISLVVELLVLEFTIDTEVSFSLCHRRANSLYVTGKKPNFYLLKACLLIHCTEDKLHSIQQKYNIMYFIHKLIHYKRGKRNYLRMRFYCKNSITTLDSE